MHKQTLKSNWGTLDGFCHGLRPIPGGPGGFSKYHSRSQHSRHPREVRWAPCVTKRPEVGARVELSAQRPPYGRAGLFLEGL